MTIKETQCSKSWTDININLDTRSVSYCCKAVFHPFPDKLTEEFLSTNATITERRQQSTEGHAHSDCVSCWNDYDKGNSAFREWANKWSPEFFKQYKNVLIDDKFINYIQINPSKTCDMSCIYCHAGSSSKIAQEEGIEIQDNTSEEDYTVFKSWLGKHIRRTDHLEKDLIFNFLGGEATASERFYELVDAIEESAIGTTRAIRLEICTNANSKKFLMDKVISKIDTSKLKWGIAISNESFGNDAELIRDGLSWDRFTENFKRYIQHPNIELIVLSPTVNIFNLKSFPDYIKWVFEQFKTYAPEKEFTWYGNFISWPDELDIANLPKQYDIYLEQAKQVVLDYSDNLNHKDKENFGVFFDNMKQRISASYNPDYKQQAQQFLERKQQFKKTDKLIKLMENLDL